MKTYLFAITAAAVIALAAHDLFAWVLPVSASTTPNGCSVIGTIGNVIVAHCVDEENGGAVFANSAGFMVLEQ